MIRAALYTRVSSDEQLDGYSLSAQEQAGRAFITARGWRWVKTYEERGRSGKTIFRPELQEMLKAAEAGAFDVIVCHKLDRFSRSLVDVLVQLKHLGECGVSFVSVTENFDFTTPFGKLMLAVLGAFAEWYLDNLRTEIAKGKKERARQGFWNGTLSFGYTTPARLRTRLIRLGEDFKSGSVPEDRYSRDSDLIEQALERYESKPDTAAVPCPFDAPAVLLAYDRYGTGMFSDKQIAELLTNAGYRIYARRGNTLITKDTIQDLLQNRFYVGETSYGRSAGRNKREWLPGNHEPIVSADLFERCQEVRARRATQYVRAPGPKRCYPLSSLMVCLECGTAFVGQYRSESRYYRDPAVDRKRLCSQHVRSVEADAIEEQVFDLIASLQLPENWQHQVKERLAESAVQKMMTRTQRESITSQMDRLQKLFLLGDIGEKDYVQRRDELNGQLDLLPVERSTTMVDLKKAAQLLNNLPAVWRISSLDERRALLHSFFRKIYIMDGEIKAVEPTANMWVLLRYARRGEQGSTPRRVPLIVPFGTPHQEVLKLVA